MQIGSDRFEEHQLFLSRDYDLNGDKKKDVIAWFRRCNENNPDELPFEIYYNAADTVILNNNPIDEIVDGVIESYGEKVRTLNYNLLVSQYSVMSTMPPCSGLISLLM